MEVTRKLLVFSSCVLSGASPGVGARLNMGLHGAPFISILCIEIIPAHWHHLGSLRPGQDRQVTLSMSCCLWRHSTGLSLEGLGTECQKLSFVSTEKAEQSMSRD